METTRKLQKVGGSIALTIPAEMARELGLSAGDEVRMSSDGGEMRVRRGIPHPRPEVVEFMARFMKEYDADLRSLADR